MKLLKLNAKDAIRSGATTTSSSGSVMRRKTCQALPPSTRAASISSPGIDCSAPMETRKKYGKLSHRLTRSTETFAQCGSKSHGTLRWKRRFTTPNWSLSRPRQTSSDRKPGIAHGMTSVAR